MRILCAYECAYEWRAHRILTAPAAGLAGDVCVASRGGGGGANRRAILSANSPPRARVPPRPDGKPGRSAPHDARHRTARGAGPRRPQCRPAVAVPVTALLPARRPAPQPPARLPRAVRARPGYAPSPLGHVGPRRRCVGRTRANCDEAVSAPCSHARRSPFRQPLSDLRLRD